jgi:2-desacetyl-2-hydroxyethyl bacteriochlorophyllide A dehydrogenase
MKAMLLNAPERLAFGDAAAPTAGPGQVLVRVTHSGICGTDLKIYRGVIPVGYPLIMGHEIIGEVADGDAGEMRAGDKVIVDPQLFCGACVHCRMGASQLCVHGKLIGRDTNGGFAEYVAVPASHVFRLPDSIDGRTAPLIQVLTTCVHAQRLMPIFPGESLVVLGLGVTGQLHAQLARASGAAPVIGVTRGAARRRLAERLGAHLTIAGGEGAVEKVLGATDGRGADVVIETTGMVASVADAIRMARSGGRILLFGIITAKDGALPFYELYFKELAISNSRAAKSEDFSVAIEMVRQGTVRLEPLVSHVMPLSELNAALHLLDSTDGQRMKIILENS